MKTYFRILSFTVKYKKAIVLHIFFTILAVFFTGLAFPILQPVLDLLFSDEIIQKTYTQIPEFAYTIDYLQNIVQYFILVIIEAEGRQQALTYIILLIVLLIIIGNVFRYTGSVYMSIVRTKVIEDIRRALFSKMIQLQVSYFEGERKGDLMTRITSDVNEVENSVVTTFESIIRDPLTVMVYFILMLMISVQLTIFMFILLPVTAVFISSISKSLKRDAFNAQGMYSRIMSVVDETISGIRIIKAFNAENYIKNAFNFFNQKYSYLSRKQWYKKQLVPPFSEVTGVITVGIILWFGGRLVFADELEASRFLVYILLFTQILKPAKNFSAAFTQIFKGMASGERLLKMMDSKLSIKDKDNAMPVNAFENSIEFNNVSFSYLTEPVLQNINLRIEKGKIYALVGPSGSGKTTLTELILRFYDPLEGQVLLDGKDLKDIVLEDLRKLIAVVTQDPILFNDTIHNNIAFGNPVTGREEVIKAAKAANAHEFIMKTENGYDTQTGDRGGLLSGGQRQRISIARAILNNPPILILDEATSALDTSSEKLVQDALFKLMKSRTSIVIAHRLSTIQDADEIIVLDKGNLVQTGSHQSLIKTDGMYKNLYRLQKLGQE